MAEVILPVVVDRLADVVLQQLGERVNLVLGVEEEVRNLSRKFSILENMLRDAEMRKLREDDVRVWLEVLEGIAYEMEDVLEEWNMKILKPSERKPTSLLGKVRSFIPSLCSCLKQVPVRNDIAVKIKKINDELEYTLREADKFKFVSDHSSSHGKFRELKHPMTTSIFDESEVCGREHDKDSLLKYLLSETEINSNTTRKEVGENGVKVISIVGLGGSGKTTLAQFLYNNDGVEKYFPLRKWVCVSNPFDEVRIARALIESPENSLSDLLELESLLQEIKKLFSKKRFLVVLDDVWTEDSSKWKPFRDSLKDGPPGSIILVTTRSGRVARAVDTYYQYNLGLLEHSDCWFIIKQKSLSKRPDLCKRVEKVGEEIAKKCKGLPLAAKILGGLLQFKDTPQEWKEVLNSEIWKLEEANVELFSHFYLSYNEFSPQLKQCFSYCAVFPKDTEIDVNRMIRLWMAQGYVGHSSRRGDEMMEKKGREYFKILAVHSFFQELRESPNDENVIKSCKMHDIVHDFAQFLRKGVCQVFDGVDQQSMETQGGFSLNERTRHLTLLNSYNFSLINNNGLNMRSLFLSTSGELPINLYTSLKSLRSLELPRSEMREFPREMGNLIHLRFLDLSHNEFVEFPDVICNLLYLESLDIRHCKKLEHLPVRIGDLVHLRCLLNFGTDCLTGIPSGVEKLTMLHTLDRFIPSSNAASFNNISKLTYLEMLGIYFERNEDFDSSSIEILESLTNLQVLEMCSYPAPQWPQWIVTNPLISNLTSLVLMNAYLISSLPALGKLSSLQHLSLFEIPNLRHIGLEFYGLSNDLNDEDGSEISFPSLRTFDLGSLQNWETWADANDEHYEKMKNGTISIMPRLKNLTLWWCGKLEALPDRVLGMGAPSSLKINVCGCDQLKKE